MNNVKVRIYELSRELNLENKDILAVCERLNIAVKSHSSTITESDAERIEKYVATHPIVSEPEEGGSATGPAQSGGFPSGEKKKQQILEIRRPNKIRLEHHHPSEGSESEANAAPVATPPKPPNSQPSALKSETNPSELSKPNTSPQPPRKPENAPDNGASFAADRDTPTPSEKPTPRPSEAKSEAESPKLVAPPVRPVSPSPKSSQPPRKPVLKPNKPSPKAGDASDGNQKPPERPAAKQKQRPAPAEPAEKEKEKEKEIREVKKRSPAKPAKPVPELQPPPARQPKRPVKGDAPEVEEETELETPDLEDDTLEVNRPKRGPTLKRPQPLTPPKKRPGGIDEDEDEIDELSDKAGKAAKAKVKRPRIKPVIEDEEDEDFDNIGSSSSDSAILSMSLARPPKPKDAEGSGRSPAASGSGARGRKPMPSRPSAGGGGGSAAAGRRAQQPKQPDRPERLVVRGPMTVQELSQALGVPETEIIKRLFSRGIAVNITETLDFNTISTVCEELAVTVETEEQRSAAEKPDNIFNAEDLENLQRRPPVVTIMGHVDHGKTTLLDSIRKTKVAQGEAGGITQHIGAYHVDVENEAGEMQQVVFLDTPGHEAFTAMRARGTRVTDIAILVVAADDGVRPQTIEAISHAKAAGVPIVVAINKMDKEAAQPDRVKQELMEHGLVPEEWGGETIMVPVSAINGENLDSLLEMLLLVAEVEDLYANPNRFAKGTVIEAHLDKARGPVATLLVQNGTLRVGDVIVAGSALGKVRAMVNDRAERVEEASPSFAVEVLGLRDVPAAGDEFEVFESEKEASALASGRADTERQSRLLQGRVSLSALSARVQEGELKDLNIILKGDVQGSVEAIVNALKKLPQKEVQLRLLLAAPGEVTETDIDLAAASDAVLIGFNTTLAHGARQAADRAGVDIREYNIIYNLLDDIQAAMEGMLEPELVEEPLGQAEVRAIFPVGRSRVAGCYVQSGKLIRNCKIRVHRGSQVLYDGFLDSLKRIKEDVKEVNAGYECGIGTDNFNDWTEGDSIEAYRMVTKRRTLSM
ncbi:translation initiation factor IF-2 [Lyngbya sp. CCY1209]|uniref:translation initiation factor IF-2 n=1 Tax=Lyngbya sp. CCY1209 TaxID=2886103 RepID=UPI002D20CCF7|nr:translation initiation factor IF-2 [Lyngbya sp. CCY1209]MEB3886488.1 translation initiation factor IF-2 [Lyngbya sp. CCY1209]